MSNSETAVMTFLGRLSRLMRTVLDEHRPAPNTPPSSSVSTENFDIIAWEPVHRGDVGDPIVRLFSNSDKRLLDILSAAKAGPVFTTYTPGSAPSGLASSSKSKTQPPVSQSSKKPAPVEEGGVCRIRELCGLLAVLHRSPAQYEFWFPFNTLLDVLEKQEIVRQIMDGLEESYSSWKAQRCENAEMEKDLIMIYAEVLFFIVEHVVHAAARKISSIIAPQEIVRLYDFLCDVVQGTKESFQQRVALLIVGAFCILNQPRHSSEEEQTQDVPNLLLPLRDKILHHFASSPRHTGCVSHFTVVALLQHHSLRAAGATVEDSVIQLWNAFFPVLSQGTMFDPDFSPLMEHDGTRSVVLHRVRQAMGEALQSMWCQVRGSSWWSVFSFQSLHSICRSAYLFEYTWVETGLRSMDGLTEFVTLKIRDTCREHVAASEGLLAAESAVSTTTRASSLSVSATQSSILSYLTLYAYLWAAAAEFDFESAFSSFSELQLSTNETNESNGDACASLGPEQIAALSFIFPMRLQLADNGRALQCLPQFILHLEMMLHSPHYAPTAGTAVDPAMSLYFDACSTLFSVLLTTVPDDQLDILQEASGTRMDTLLLHLFRACANTEQSNYPLVAQLFTCFQRFHKRFAQPVMLSDYLLHSSSMALLGQQQRSGGSIGIAVFQTHLYGILGAEEEGVLSSSGSASMRLLVALGHLSSGILTHCSRALTFFLTVFRYVHSDLSCGKLILSVDGANILRSSPNLLSILMEGGAALLRRATSGFLEGVEGSVQGALDLVLRITCGIASAAREYEQLACVSIPVGDDLHHTGSTPGITMLLQILFSKVCSPVVQRTAAEMWCACLQSSRGETFHTIRLSLRSLSRSNLSEEVIDCLKRDVGKRENIFRLQVLIATQHYDSRLFMHLISQQIAGLGKGSNTEDLTDLRIVRVLCEVVMSKESSPQEKGLALQLILGLGLPDAVQLASVFTLLSKYNSYEGIYLASAGADYICAAIQAKKKTQQGNDNPTNHAAPPSFSPSKQLPRAGSFSLPAATSAGATNNTSIDMLQSVLESSTNHIMKVVENRELDTAINQLSETATDGGSGACEYSEGSHPCMNSARNECFHGCRREKYIAVFLHSVVLGASFCFAGPPEGHSGLNFISSLLYSITSLCHSIEKIALLLAVEARGASDDWTAPVQKLLEAVLTFLCKVIAVVRVPMLSRFQEECAAACLYLGKTLTCLIESSGVQITPISRDLHSTLFYFLQLNAHSISTVTDVLVIFRSLDFHSIECSHVLEEVCSTVAQKMVTGVLKWKNTNVSNAESDRAEWDRFVEEAHLFMIRHGRGCPSVALRAITSSLVHSMLELSKYVVVMGASNVWVSRLTCRLHFLQTLLHLHPHVQGYVDAESLMALAVALGQAEYMPAVPSGMATGKRVFTESAGHEVWCAVLELLCSLLTSGRRDGSFSAVKTGWLRAIIPICFTPRFQHALAGFSFHSREVHPLFVWDILECHLCAQVVAILSSLGGFVGAVVPFVIAGFQTMHSSRFLYSCSVSTNTHHVEAEEEMSEHDRMKLYLAQAIRDQLSFLLVQPSCLISIENFCSEAYLISEEMAAPRLTFMVLFKFIYRHLRSIQRSSSLMSSSASQCTSRRSSFSSDGFGSPMTPGGISRSPSMETCSVAESVDEQSTLERGEYTAEVLPFYVESVDLALGVFLKGARAVHAHVERFGRVEQDRGLEKELHSSGDRLVFTLESIQKDLEDSVAELVPFVKSRREHLQKVMALLHNH